MTRVVGRDAELEAIGGALDGIDRGFAAIAVCGDAGIGKTTVWQWGIAEARGRGCWVSCCRPAESERWLSFSGLADLMAGVPGHVLDGLPDPQRYALDVALLNRAAPQTGTDHRAISTAVTSVVRALAAATPVVVAVDDLQWLDAATAEVLTYMVRRLGDEPVLLLATARSELGQALPAGLGHALGDDRVLRVQLSPLAPDELQELVRDRTALVVARPEVQPLHEASGGNPLFAIEIARALLRSHTRLIPGEPLPVPESLAALVAARIGSLSERTRGALLVISALAHPTAGQVRAALGRGGMRLPGAGEGLLDSAEESGIVTIRDDEIRFTHPLFSSAIYSAAPAARRRKVHRALAGVVHDIEEQAWHMALAVQGPDREVAALLEKAASAAQARGALRTAARLWELASHRTPAGQPGDATRRTVAAAVCLSVLGDAGRARSMLEAVTAGLPAGQCRAGALLWLATILYHERSSALAVSMCRQALAEAGDDLLLRARLHLRAAWFADHDTAARVRDAEAAAAILNGQELAEPDLLACAVLARGYYRFLAGRGIGWDDLNRGRDLLSPHGRSWERAWARYIVCQWTKSLDLPQAHARTLAVVQPAADSGDELAVAHILFHVAETECWLGRLRQAKAHAAQAAAGFEQTGQQRWRGLALYIRALPDAYLGEADAARAAAERGLEIVAPDDDPYVGVLHLGLLGFIALSQGELAAADHYLSRAGELVAAMGLAEPARHRFHGDHLETVLGLGDVARAAALQQDLEDRARRAPYPWLMMITTRGRALLQAAQGELEAAARTAQQAVTESQAAHMPFEHARTLLATGRIRRRRKEKLLAGQAFQQARQIFDDLHTPLWSAHATAEIGRLGLRPTSPEGLTPTEERVARLVATGRTNREVAGTLHITQKTVEANLARVFRKLGISSRKQLAGHDRWAP